MNTYGLDFFKNSDKYSLEYFERKNVDDCSIQFDFNDPEAILGQTIYEKNNVKIVVSDVETVYENYVELYFDVIGNYNFIKGEGSFISPISLVPSSNGAWILTTPNNLISVEPVDEYQSRFTAATTAFEKLTNQFSISVIALNLQDSDTTNNKIKNVEVKFCGLYEINWDRR